MATEAEPFRKRYRLLLEFEVELDEAMVEEYDDEGEGEEFQRTLNSQRQLLHLLLTRKRDLLDELARKKVLEDADGAVDMYELKEQLLVENLENEALLRPALDALTGEAWNFFQEASEQEAFEEAADPIVNGFSIDLVGASLQEVEMEEEDYWP